MDRSFPKLFRLLTRPDFRRVFSFGKRIVSKKLLIDIAPNTLEHPRLGLVVSKKFGKAHERNKFKRALREAFRNSKEVLPPLDLVIHPRKSAAFASVDELAEDLKCSLNSIHLTPSSEKQ